MDIEIKRKELQEFFNNFSQSRIEYRRKKKYYWNSITRQCGFFIHPDDSVIEIGCSTGELLNGINAKRKVGIDFSPGMISLAKQQFKEIEFYEMDAENIQISEKFDVVILSNLIGVLIDVQKVFKEIRKICHEHTKVIITYYNYFWEPMIHFAELIGIKKKLPKQNWLSKYDISNLLYLEGFEVYRERRAMLIPYNIPIISYIFNKLLSHLPVFNLFALNHFSFARLTPQYSEKEVFDKYTVSVLIPARNEEGNIENAIQRIPEFGKHVEIIFVEGNSTDNTWDRIQDVQKKYIDKCDIKIAQQSGKGKGDAVRKGFDMATGDILMILDADLTVPPEDLPKFYNALATGKGDFINGTRLVYPMEKRAMRFFNILGNKFFSIAFSWLLEQPVKDTLCGTKVMYRNDYVRLVANRSYFGDFDPFGDFDLLFGAFKLNLKIIDMPIRYQERIYGDTNISRFKHGLLLLRMWFFALKKIKFN
jgi:ubiquinone/menaquinone biosynthesis C-methylase UbiE